MSTGSDATMTADMSPYLRATSFIDFDQPSVQAFAERVCAPLAGAGAREKAVQLYYAVRDEIRYDPYDLSIVPDDLRASSVITKGVGYCVTKAVVLAAVTRQQGIPSRLGFADVRNHLSTERLRRVMGTDVFFYHGFTELFLEGRWVKATPAFNLALCRRFQVKPLEFDGINDSIFHECNAVGQKHLEYLREHGSFADLPHEQLFAAYRQHYPALFRLLEHAASFDFYQEAERERRRDRPPRR